MKFVFFLSILALLTSCTTQIEEHVSVFAIEGTYQDTIMTRGMAGCIAPDTLVTSAHVVPDDRYTYEATGLGKVTVKKRDTATDIAELSILSGSCIPSMWKKGSVTLGERVFARVVRSGSTTLLSGVVTSRDQSLIGYDAHGTSQTLSGVILTDIVFVPGESGAPIFDTTGNIVDVVHVGGR